MDEIHGPKPTSAAGARTDRYSGDAVELSAP
jgi:hypothetical protein